MFRGRRMLLTTIFFTLSCLDVVRATNDYNWISQCLSFVNPIPENLSPTCFNHTTRYLEDVRSLSAWAVNMMDSNGRYPSGTLLGNIHALGNFEQCLAVSSPLGEFTGKYCLLELEFAILPTCVQETFDSLNTLVEMATSGRRKFEQGTDWINGTLPLSSYSRGDWALCMPSTCSVDDVRIIGETIINRATAFSGFNVSVILDESRCYDRNYQRPFEIIDLISMFTFAMLGSIIIVATVYSNIVNPKKITRQGLRLMSYFSLSNSWRALKKEPTEAITCVMGIRSLSTAWVVMTHQFVMMPQVPFINKVDTLKTNGNYFYYPMWNSYLDVDTFLLVSGLLRAQSLMKDFSLGRRGVVHSAIRRYLRLTPAYLIVVLFFASIFDRLDSGPFWNYYVGRNAEACRKYWWQNLLYVNNYVSHNEKCGLQTWYLSADMQLFLAAPLVVYPLWKWRSVGTLIWIVALIVSIASPFMTTLMYELPGTFVPTVSNSKLNEYTHKIYMATHNRMSPYIVGLYLGTIFHRVKSTNLPKWLLTLGWSSSLAVMYGCVYGAMGITSVNHATSYDPWESVLYGGFHRFGWAVSVAWLVYACHMGYGGPIDKFLSCKVFGYIGRVSYCVYLSHMGIILYNAGVLQAPKQLHIYLTIRDFFGDFAWIFIVSSLVYLCVEAPFQNIYSSGTRAEQSNQGCIENSI